MHRAADEGEASRHGLGSASPCRQSASTRRERGKPRRAEFGVHRRLCGAEEAGWAKACQRFAAARGISQRVIGHLQGEAKGRAPMSQAERSDPEASPASAAVFPAGRSWPKRCCRGRLESPRMLAAVAWRSAWGPAQGRALIAAVTQNLGQGLASAGGAGPAVSWMAVALLDAAGPRAADCEDSGFAFRDRGLARLVVSARRQNARPPARAVAGAPGLCPRPR